MGPDRAIRGAWLLRGLGVVLAGGAVVAIAAACGDDDPPTRVTFPTADDGGDEPDALDAGALDAATDARRDAACPNPCDGTCCSDFEGCVENDAGKRACVATCVKGDDCATGCCAPATNAKGDPVGPFVCKPNDGQEYSCCNDFTTCKGRGCCVVDFLSRNQYCAVPCSDNSVCGEAHCARASFSSTSTSCRGTGACGL